jgi:peptidoglycan/LPS O-acetylase OafA/YrhL
VTILGRIVLIAVGTLAVAVFWDRDLRGRRGEALLFNGLALAVAITAGVLQAEEVRPWALIVLLVSGALFVMGGRAERRHRSGSRRDEAPAGARGSRRGAGRL